VPAAVKKRSAPAGLALRYALVATVMVAIVYGSLYPFVFRDAGAFAADLQHLAGTWKQGFQSRGDILANLLLYMPLGLTIALALGRSGLRSLAIAAVCGAMLSIAIELAQFYDASRVSALSDFYLNVAGTLGGALIGRLASADLAGLSWPSGSAPAFARLLLLAWVGWRLYPYVPTIDLHKYWHSVRPLLTADVSAYGIFRYAVLWLSVGFLLRTGVGPKKLAGLLLATMLCFFAAKIVVIGQVLSLPELLGAALAVVLSGVFLGRFARFGVPLLAALLLSLVIFSRVLPWQIGAPQKAFQWVPFYSFLHGGSLQVNVISFAEKFYLYGAVLLLLVTAGMKLRIAIILECAILLATSALQVFMVGRSAEISDAFLALVLGLVYALLRGQSRETPAARWRAGR
jgi:glycopeptide antibiotics resistance protein